MARRKTIKADKNATKSGKPAKKKRASRKRGPGKGMTPFVPTDEQRVQVEALTGLGLTLDECALVIINPRTKKGISKMTLQKYFPDEIDRGQAVVKGKVVAALFKRAIDHSHPQGAASAMFICKCRYGWQEKQQVEITSKSGVLVAPAAMTPEDWIAAQAKADAKKKPPEEG